MRPAPAASSTVDLDAFAEHLRDEGRTEGTIRKRRSKIVAFEQWLAPLPVGAATGAQLDRWLDSLRLTPASRNVYVYELAAFYRWAVEVGLVGADPTAATVQRRATKPPGAHLVVLPRPAKTRGLDTIAGRAAHYDEVLQRQELSPRTIRQYTREMTNAEYWCEAQGYTLRNVPAVVFAQYVEARPKTYSSRLILRVAVTHYWRIYKRKEPPVWIIRMPRRPRMVCRALTEEEAITLAKAARERGDRPGVAVLIAMYQGFRREEVSAVRWADLDEEGWIKVMGKGDQPAKIPLHPVVAEALSKLDRLGSEWVFPGREGRYKNPPVSTATVWQWVLVVARDAGLENVTTHRLRHTCLATANDNTGDLRAVQDYARHSKVDTTAGYTRSTGRRLVAVMNAVNYEEAPTDDPDVSAGRIVAAAGALERFAASGDGGRLLLAEVAGAVEKVLALTTPAVRMAEAVEEPSEAKHLSSCKCENCRATKAAAERSRRAALQRRDLVPSGDQPGPADGAP